VTIRRRSPIERGARRVLILSAAVALSSSFLPLVAVTSAHAAPPTLTLSESAPASLLYGAAATITLTATNPTATPEYNLAFSDVLPVGVSYVAGSTLPTTAGEPTVIHNKPAAGQTTLIWNNVSDLQPAATDSLTFTVQPDINDADVTNPDLPGATYHDAASVYDQTAPRTLVAFSATTGVVTAGTFTATATAVGTTTITPLIITKTENSPESELPRGVHDHKGTYTLTVTNSGEDATTGTVVDDYLPASLEFLGCGGVDHTTNALGTNPGSVEEYPGSGGLATGTTLGSGCPTPVLVQTVALQSSGGPNSPPAQPITAGTTIYTQVEWNTGTLAPHATVTISYLAAVPLKANTMTWPGGTTPNPATGAQGSNLDNNTGVESHDAESITNLATVGGTYTGPVNTGSPTAVTASGTDTIDAIDLAVQKSIDNPQFTQGSDHTYSLHYETSEYRRSTGVVLTDNLPAGLCPLGLQNFDTLDPTPQPDCAPQAGVGPSVPYSSVTENADSSFTITWALGSLPANTDLTITMPTVDRGTYTSADPTGAGDGLTNTTTITGTAIAVAAVPGETATETPTNGSQAGETTGAPVLTKRVAANPGPAGFTNCAAANYSPVTTPDYVKGDQICFQLETDFPGGVDTLNPTITDFLPPNSTYVPGSAVATGADTVPIISTDSSVAGQVTFTLGSTRPSGRRVALAGSEFEVDLAITATADPTAGNAFDLTANLMKLTSTNTAGAAISQRTQATYDLAQPVLALKTGVDSVNNGTEKAANTDHVQVADSNPVGFRVDVTNNGAVTAVSPIVTAVMPAFFTTCAQVGALNDGGTCAQAANVVTITWAAPSIAAGTSLKLVVNTTVPATAAAGVDFTITGKVTSYQSQPDDSNALNTYVPGVGGVPAATDPTDIFLASPTLVKSETTSVTETGNTVSQATIGEIVNYKVVQALPVGTSAFGGEIVDPILVDQTYVAGSASITVSSGTTAGFVTAFSAAPTPEVTVTYPAATLDPTTVTLTFQVLVTGNPAGGLSNIASFTWMDSNGATVSTVNSNNLRTPVVEPAVTVTKNDGVGHSAGAGATVPYTIVVTNAAGASTSHTLVVTDTLPVGETSPTLINGGGVLSGLGTTPSPWVITWTLASLAPNISQTYTYSTNLPSPVVGSDTFTNNVVVTSASLDPATSPGAKLYTTSGADTVTAITATITKVASPQSVTNGQDTTYTATVTIPANVALPNFTAIDTLPDGMTFDGYGSASCSESGVSPCADGPASVTPLGTPAAAANGTTQLAWFIGDIAAAPNVRTVTLVYQAYPSETNHSGTPIVAGNVLHNLINVYWNATLGADPTSIPATSSFARSGTPAPMPPSDVTVIAPNLSIAKTVSDATPTPGENLTYTLTITNSGTSPAFDVVVHDPLPAAMNTPSVISDAGTDSSGTINWVVPGPIAAGSTKTLTFTTSLDSTQVATGATVTNTATVDSYDGVSGGHALAPLRYPTYGPTSASIGVAPIFPHLVVVKTVASGGKSGQAFVGTPFGWQIVVSDTTAAPVNGIHVADQLPPGWTYVPGSTTVNGVSRPDPTVSGQNLTFSLPAVLSAGTIDYQATPDTTAAEGAVPNVNSASASASDATGATRNATGPYQSNTDTAQALIAAADLSLQKAADGPLVPGAPIGWTFTITNHGPSAAVGPLTVVDTLPAGATAVALKPAAVTAGWACTLDTVAGTFTCVNSKGLANGASDATLDLVMTMPSGQTADVTNSGRVTSGTYDPQLANNTASATVTPAPSADLALTKSHTGNFIAGETGSYTLAVHNNGTSDAASPLTVVDTLPAGETFHVSTQDPEWSCSAAAQQVTCVSAHGLAAGQSAPAITVEVDVDASASGTLTNHATVSDPTTDPIPANNVAADPTTIDTQADLAIVKTHAGTFEAGTQGSYSLAVTNHGPSDAASVVTVSDPLPTGETFVSGTDPDSDWTCSATPSQVVTCTLTGALAANSAAPVITLTVAVGSGVTGALVNTATVSSPTTDLIPANNSSTDNTGTPSTDANLRLVKAATTASFVAGQDASYTFDVDNLGPSDAAAPITMTDPLPTGETYVSQSGAGWSCSAVGALVTCTNSSGVISGASLAELTMTVHVDSAFTGAALDNTADVSSPTPDTHQLNNSSEVTTPVTQAAQLVITKSHTGTFTPGTQDGYTIGLDNNGPSDALNVVITDPLPAGESFVSASGTAVAGSTWSCAADAGQDVTCTLDGPMPTGASTTITLTVAVDPGFTDGSLLNVATVTTSTPLAIGSITSASNTVSNVTPSADLAISKSHIGALVAGQPATYLVTVIDNGPSDSAGPIDVVDTLPTGETFTSAAGAGWICTGGAGNPTVDCTHAAPITVASGAQAITVTVGIDSSVAPGATLTNDVSVTPTTADPDPTNNSATDSGTVGTSADLTILKSHVGSFVAGQDATYTLAVSNNGPSDTTGTVTVTDPLPAGETFISATGSDWTCTAAGQTVTCTTTDSVATGAAASPITLTVALGAAAYPSVTNTATVTSDTPDSDPTNNSSTDTGSVGAASDLRITKSHQSKAEVDAPLTYTIAVNNAGLTTDPGPITVTDPLPAGETFVSGGGTAWTCAVGASQLVTCTTAGPLAAGASTSFGLTVKMGLATFPSVINTASVTSPADTTTDSSSDPTTVLPVATLVLHKRLLGALVNGKDATYVISVTNDGPLATDGAMTITDQLPAGLGYVSTSGSTWSCRHAGQLVTCTRAVSLADHATSEIKVAVVVTAAAGQQITNVATVTSQTPQASTDGDSASSGAKVVQAHAGGSGGGGLPFTGLDVIALLGVSGLLTAAGIGLTALSRRHRRA
jgi:uncharacterized repeat protein (TIGR01451 family)